MSTAVRLLLCALVAVCLGLTVGEAIYRLPAARAALGRALGRGELLALASGAGIYESDLRATDRTLEDLIVAANLRARSRNEPINAAQTGPELSLLQSQFGTDALFRRALSVSGLSRESLREQARDQMRSVHWLEKQFNDKKATTTADAAREFFDAHREHFVQPLRLRASHLFLAAHAETPPDVTEAKRKLITGLALQISRGRSFEEVSSELSEDEATKKRGGDLDFFSSWRMPADFFDQVEKMKVGESSKPIQTHLGFHLVQVTEVRPPRELSFGEVRNEIALSIDNTRRRTRVTQLAEDLGHADYLRERR